MSDLTPFLKNLHGKKILGINPPVFDFAFFDLWAKPTGLLYLLEAMRKRGNAVRLIDCVVEAQEKKPLSFGRFKIKGRIVSKPLCYKEIPRRYRHFGLDEEGFQQKLLEGEKPDFIFLTSGMTYWYPGVLWCIDHVKKILPQVPLFLGGLYARLCPNHALQCGADAVQTEPLGIPVSYPALDLYDNPTYGIVNTAWGCPFHCDYCASGQLFPHYRRRSLSEVFEEISFQCQLSDIKDLAFYDDALLIKKESHFYPLCDWIRSHFHQLRLHTPNGLHVNEIDPLCAKILFETGFRTLRLSLEGIDPKMQQISRYKTSQSYFKRAVASLMEAGYKGRELETYILVGVPGQNPASVASAIDFVLESGARPKLAEYSPIPGTPLFQKATALCPNLEREPLLQNNSVFCTFFGKTLSPENLQSLKDRAQKFFETPSEKR